MINKLFSLMVSFLVFGLLLSNQMAAASRPDKYKYQEKPFQIGPPMIPKVLLLLSKDLKMFQQAYPGISDLDGDNRIDTGFNPGQEYLGYFDSRSCYAYSGNTKLGLNNTHYAYGSSNGYFFRVGETLEDDSQSVVNQGRPWKMRLTIPSPRSKAGVCKNSNTAVTYNGQRTFSGNWLNYLSSSRMDIIRKILYGGKRTVDTATRTVLELSHIPADSSVWGMEIRSDDYWQEITPLNAYYDISKFTPFDKPQGRSAHFFARGRNMGNENFPVIRMLPNVTQQSFNSAKGLDSLGNKVKVTAPYGRYWDWVEAGSHHPDDMVLANDSVKMSIQSFRLQVEVCNKQYLGDGEGCQRYPGATPQTSDDVFKPVGLLQHYGSGATPMHFGLMTGTYNTNARLRGAKLRNHIGPIYGYLPGKNKFIPAVDTDYGTIIPDGLISNIDRLAISGRYSNSPFNGPGSSFQNTHSWGNPIGEMVYEAMRYISGADKPSLAFSDQADSDITGSPINDLTGFSRIDSWKGPDRPDMTAAWSCAKPVIFLISDLDNNYDGDDIGNDLDMPLLSNVNFPKGNNITNLPNKFILNDYLWAITVLENLMTGKANQFIYSIGAMDGCSPKTMTRGLGYVKGICPDNPFGQGTFSASALAHWGHIHNMNSRGNLESSLDLYALAMSSGSKEISFPINDTNATSLRKINFLPYAISSNVPGKMLSPLNFTVEEWEVDRLETLFHAKITARFSDVEMGGKWVTDAQVTYELDLVTDGSTSQYIRDTTPVKIDSGDLSSGGPYYKFKNSAKAYDKIDLIYIQPIHVKGFIIRSKWEQANSSAGLALGYSISGTERDGTYMDLTVNQPPDQAVDYLTPPTCQYSQGSKYYPHYCGKKIRDLKEQTRGFRYYDKKLIFPNLPNPLWLAAKYGGFIDANGNGLPDPGEWEGPGGDPANYFHTSNMSKLSEIFGQAFRDIANSSKSAKAIASFMDSWPTKGISIQTSYYPEYVNPTDSKQKTTWVGSVYALFVDKWGNFREDSDGDAHLTYKTDPVSQTGDRVIGLNNPGFGNGSNSQCYEAGQKISRCEDIDGNNNLSVSPGTTGRPANIHRLKSLWDAGQWLSSLDTGKLLSGSRPFGLPATAYNGQRLVYYGQPISSGRTELRLFDAQNSLNELEKLLLHPNFAQVLPKSGTLGKTQTSLRLIQYILGADQPDWRSRTVGNPWTDDKSPVVWRLGDVMNSKPAVVGPPSSNYDLIYDDDSYAAFKKAFANRRHMVYFGSNDGLLHAVNAGFLGTFGNGQVYYQTQAPGTKTVKHELGAEVWAYVPTSLLPHLQWMADPQYSHAFYVDMKPLISDLKIKGQWRTVLFGGLRLGGRPIEGPNPGGVQDPHFFSELFALDITDPESPPVLLWRYSSLELGLALGQPTVVSSNGKWYVLIGSGPVTDVPFFDKGQPSIDYGLQSPYGGVSHQNARIIVLEADTGREAVNTDPVSGGNPDYLLASEKDSFFNEPFLPVAQIKSPIWNNHTVYYGLTQSRDLVDCTDKGAVYRIEMAASDGSPLPVEKWKLRRLINTERPVTGAVNSTYDSRGQLWVLFGTGRLWSLDDVSPCTSAPTSLCHDNHQQFIYGIKEELNKNGYMAFSDRTSEANRLLDLSGAIVYKDGRVANLINQPLLLTGQGGTSNYDIIYQTALSPSAVGYKRMLDIGKVLDPKQSHAYEMLISQPKLMPIGNGHSALSFTSFEPSNYSCGELGHGYLYMLDTFTGLPKPAFRKYFPSASASSPSSPVDPDLVTGAIQTGPGRPTESSVFAGDGKMIVRASSSSGGIFDLEIPSAEALGSELISWREVFDMGFDLPKDVMTKGF